MAKSKRRKTERRGVGRKTRKSRKTAKSQPKVVEYIDCLSELHKLQGVLLAQLKKEI